MEYDDLPGPPHLDMSRWTREQFDAEMQKGYDAILAGRTIPAEEVFAEFLGQLDETPCPQSESDSAHTAHRTGGETA